MLLVVLLITRCFLLHFRHVCWWSCWLPGVFYSISGVFVSSPADYLVFCTSFQAWLLVVLLITWCFLLLFRPVCGGPADYLVYIYFISGMVVGGPADYLVFSTSFQAWSLVVLLITWCIYTSFQAWLLVVLLITWCFLLHFRHVYWWCCWLPGVFYFISGVFVGGPADYLVFSTSFQACLLVVLLITWCFLLHFRRGCWWSCWLPGVFYLISGVFVGGPADYLVFSTLFQACLLVVLLITWCFLLHFRRVCWWCCWLPWPSMSSSSWIPVGSCNKHPVTQVSKFHSLFPIISQHWPGTCSETLPCGRQGPTFTLHSITWLLVVWQRKAPGHQQPWY